MLATYASLRWGELAALRRIDLDLDAATVRVERTQVEVGGRVTEGPTKSPAGRRVVAFPPALVPLLGRHLVEYVGEEPTALVFTGPTGARLRRNNFGKLAGWSAAVAAVGAPGLHFHDLRHTGNAFAAQGPRDDDPGSDGTHGPRLDSRGDDLPSRRDWRGSDHRRCLAGGVRRRI
jgi:integrase